MIVKNNKGVTSPLSSAAADINTTSTNGNNHSTTAETPIPIPTTTTNSSLDYGERKIAIVSLLTTIIEEQNIISPSNKTAFHEYYSIGSPQRLALDWIVYNDVQFSTDPYDSSSSKQNSNKLRLIQRYVLAVFYYSMNGPNWISLYNKDWLSIETSECDWSYVVCDEKTDVIVGIDVRNHNNLIGTLPKELAMLSSLHTLIFMKNSVSLNFPEELVESLSKSLVTLQFYQNDSTGGGKSNQTDNDSNIITVAKSSTPGGGDIGSTIPSMIYELKSLQTLRIEESQIKGTISSNIQKLRHLQTLSLSGSSSDDNNNGNGNAYNHLSGTIPFTMAYLTKLHTLDLSYNNFIGTIPNGIGTNLQSLTFLGLNNNNFDGTLPQQICTNLRRTTTNKEEENNEVNSGFTLDVMDHNFMNDCNIKCPYDTSCCQPCSG